MSKETDVGHGAVAGRVERPVRPDPERVAFEAWLNPGNYPGNVSPWMEEPGRYQQDTHQLAWLAWRAGRKQEREQWRDLLRECEPSLADMTGPYWPAPVEVLRRVQAALRA